MNEFLAINNLSEGLYKEKGSKFLAYAYPVKTEEEIADIIIELKKKYHDARHHCYAYVIGMKNQRYRANDDGEPTHSAGDPILGQIRSHGLTNTLVVVVRYFGGTKLGVGGLISAYKIAAGEALSLADVVSVYSKTKFKISFEYSETSAVERVLSEFEIDFQEKSFTTSCEYIGLLIDEEISLLKVRLELLKATFEVL